MTSRAALILAGGSAKRFQTQNQIWRDKALAELNGKPLLVHVILNLQAAADEVVVCVNNEERQTRYSQVLEKHALKGVRFVVDEKGSLIKGPLLAIMSGLHAVSADYCLTVPVDMPFLKPQVADYTFRAVEGFDVAVPMWPDGTLETLVMALQRETGLEIAETLCAVNKSRADSIMRGASKLRLISPLKEIKALDPGLRSFVNINSQQDLIQPKTRSTEGKVTDSLRFDRGNLPILDLRHLRDGGKMLDEGKFSEAQTTFAACIDSFEAKNTHFWAGVSAEKLAQATEKQSGAKAKEAYLRAANNYQAEAKTYEEKGCRLLAERALADKAWCEARV